MKACLLRLSVQTIGRSNLITGCQSTTVHFPPKPGAASNMLHAWRHPESAGAPLGDGDGSGVFRGRAASLHRAAAGYQLLRGRQPGRRNNRVGKDRRLGSLGRQGGASRRRFGLSDPSSSEEPEEVYALRSGHRALSAAPSLGRVPARLPNLFDDRHELLLGGDRALNLLLFLRGIHPVDKWAVDSGIHLRPPEQFAGREPPAVEGRGALAGLATGSGGRWSSCRSFRVTPR